MTPFANKWPPTLPIASTWYVLQTLLMVVVSSSEANLVDGSC